MRATDMGRVLGRDEGKAGFLASIGVRFMIDGDRSGGGFALVEHPMPSRALGSPAPAQPGGRVQRGHGGTRGRSAR